MFWIQIMSTLVWFAADNLNATVLNCVLVNQCFYLKVSFGSSITAAVDASAILFWRLQTKQRFKATELCLGPSNRTKCERMFLYQIIMYFPICSCCTSLDELGTVCELSGLDVLYFLVFLKLCIRSLYCKQLLICD